MKRFLLLFLCFISAGCEDDENSKLFEFEVMQNLQQLTAKMDTESSRATFDNDVCTILRCSPLEIKLKKLFVTLITWQQPDGVKISFRDLAIIRNTSFNVQRKTVVYVHGWGNWLPDDAHITQEALVSSGRDLNILIMHWNDYAEFPDYVRSWQASKEVGTFLGKALLNIEKWLQYSLDNITLVGFSMGAHVCGFAGKATKGRLHAILGLDPAAPLYSKWIPEGRLNRDDAVNVQVIHTCGNGIVGVAYNLGQQDFWVNGGEYQVGCSSCIMGAMGCSHRRAKAYFHESIKLNNFVGWKCRNSHYWLDFCRSNPTVPMGGLDINTTKPGVYYLNTNSKSPFGRGYKYR